MKPRPRSITVIGWLFIAVGAAGLLKDLWPLLTPDAGNHLARLKADGLAGLGPAWTLRVLAIAGGAGLLRGHNWARWLLGAWMILHVGLSLLHSWTELLAHIVIVSPILYLLFRHAAKPWFHRDAGAPAPDRLTV
ncbi:MAG: hypothetical protein AB7I33_03385 [Gemmatimonadales bacterium]